MRIELTMVGTRAEGHLYDHPVAHELAEELPLALSFNDFNGVERVAPLDRALTLRGVPDADAPQPGEIGYSAPTRGPVLHYRNPGTASAHGPPTSAGAESARFVFDLMSTPFVPRGMRPITTREPSSARSGGPGGMPTLLGRSSD